MIREVRVRLAKRVAYCLVLAPVSTGWTVPEQVDSVASPSPRDEETVVDVACRAELREDGQKDFVWQAVDGWVALVVDIHVL